MQTGALSDKKSCFEIGLPEAQIATRTRKYEELHAPAGLGASSFGEGICNRESMPPARLPPRCRAHLSTGSRVPGTGRCCSSARKFPPAFRTPSQSMRLQEGAGGLETALPTD